MFHHANNNNCLRKSNDLSLNLPIENGASNEKIQVKFLLFWLLGHNQSGKKTLSVIEMKTINKNEKKIYCFCQRHDFVAGVAVCHSRCYCFFPCPPAIFLHENIVEWKKPSRLTQTVFCSVSISPLALTLSHTLINTQRWKNKQKKERAFGKPNIPK